MSGIPFGFRQDTEPKPEPDESPEQPRQEINNTTAITERAWSPYVRVRARAIAQDEELG